MPASPRVPPIQELPLPVDPGLLLPADCRARGVPCLWVLIPRVGRVVGPAQHRRLLDLAKAAGFTAVVDVSDAFDGSDPATLAIHPSDFHPNALGHTLLARRMAEALWPLQALQPLLGPP